MPELTYRDLGPADIPALTDLAKHRSVAYQTGSWPYPHDPDLIARRCAPYPGCGFVHAICEDGRLIGSVGVTEGELGYMVHPEAAGRGVASTAARASIGRAFDRYDWPGIRADAWSDNGASNHILRKLGFTHWQTRYGRGRTRGVGLLYCYRLSRAEWERLRARA